MNNTMLIGGGILLLAVVSIFFWFSVQGGSSKKIKSRIDRIRRYKKIAVASSDEKQGSLRRQTSDGSFPLLTRLLDKIPNRVQFRARIERSGLNISAEKYLLISACIAFVVTVLLFILKKKFFLALFMGIIVGVMIPNMIVGMAAKKRVKRFIALFPDAIDLMVRGLRSGLPVTESFVIIGQEVQQPVGGVFDSIGESIRLGVPVEKALQDMAVKLGSTEFSFFVTSVILQRETGGNLSEILNNLSEVLRNRSMMRLKIKAMSSEAKASAYIVGALPIFVTGALMFIEPDYLTLLVTDTRGNIAAGCAVCSLCGGVFIMMKMAQFEI